MSNNSARTYEELMVLLSARSQRVHDKFTKKVIEGVADVTLLKILRQVQSYPLDLVRVGLASLSCEAVGGQPEAAEEAGLMLSLAAAGIGIHDDIIDKSPHKHFQRTILSLYGSRKTLLTGDLLIVKSWATTQNMLKTSDPKAVADVLQVYESACIALCEGEIMGISYGRKLRSSLKNHEQIIWKINADLEASAKAGAIIGRGKTSEIAALGEFGRRLGFTIALADEVKDCLNMEGNILSRLRYESIPLPIFYAAKCSDKAYLKIKEILKKPKISISDAQELLKCCFETEALAYIRDMADQNRTKAISSLDSVNSGWAGRMLKLIMDKCFENIDKMCI
jgi:geranylgeranyl pyrophosphate synthase